MSPCIPLVLASNNAKNVLEYVLGYFMWSRCTARVFYRTLMEDRQPRVSISIYHRERWTTPLKQSICSAHAQSQSLWLSYTCMLVNVLPYRYT